MGGAMVQKISSVQFKKLACGCSVRFKMFKNVLLALALFATISAFGGFAQAGLCLSQSQPVAGEIKGFVNIASNRSLYVDYIPAAPGKPTVVLLNGLTYRLGCWNDFVANLQGNGLGILRYDAMGQGETLLKYAPITGPIDYRDQVEDLHKLLIVLRVPQPAHIVGLSYGGAIALSFSTVHPEQMASLILMAPFVAPIESQDTLIKQSIAQTRIMFPLNPATDDQLYDYFLHQIAYATYPTAEPIVLENPFKLEAVFHMAQGLHNFLAKNIEAKIPKGQLHLMVALQDQYLPKTMLDTFWSQLPVNTHASRVYIDGTEHKMPEAIPQVSAQWVLKLINGDPRFQSGHTFNLDARTGRVTLAPPGDQN
jgi:pimeloyl-ACP methyl ester carboxylesterase